MGVDISSLVEFREDGEWEVVEEVFSRESFNGEIIKTDSPFHWRSYRLFAFLANIRNDFGVTPIKSHGIPEDATERTKEIATGYYDGDTDLQGDCIYLKDMLEFDYEQEFEDKNPYLGEDPVKHVTSYRDFLGEDYFRVLEELKALGAGDDVRVYYWFSF